LNKEVAGGEITSDLIDVYQKRKWVSSLGMLPKLLDKKYQRYY
jgi:hypothetical protein